MRGFIMTICALFCAAASAVDGQLEDFNEQDSVSSSSSLRNGVDDQNSAATGFGGGGGGIGDSKYFQEIYTLQYGPKQIEFGHVCESPSEWEQRYERKDFDKNRHQGQFGVPVANRYQHLPEHDKYEFGYRRGNEHHVRERHEKSVPHDGHFKTKVRWADHKGGHGEHFWDYNHAGHHDDGDGEGSDPVPSYTASQTDIPFKSPARSLPSSAYEDHATNRRAFPYEKEERDPIQSFHDEISQVQGFEVNRQEVNRYEEKPSKTAKRESEKKGSKGDTGALKSLASFTSTPKLYFDMKNGKVVDEATGKFYYLHEINT